MLADHGFDSVTLPKCLGSRCSLETKVKPIAINPQRLAAVDEYKDIIINDIKYSALLALTTAINDHYLYKT